MDGWMDGRMDGWMGGMSTGDVQRRGERAERETGEPGVWGCCMQAL